MPTPPSHNEPHATRSPRPSRDGRGLAPRELHRQPMSRRKVAMAAVGLAVVAVMAAGIAIAVAKLAGGEKEAAAGVPQLSDTWARGATQSWELTGVPESPGQPLVAFPERMTSK